MDALFSITCTTCDASLTVRDTAAIGQILSCPKCGSMIKVEPPPDWEPPAEETLEARSADRDRCLAEGEPVLSEAGSEDGAAERFDHGWASSTERRWQHRVIIGTVAASAVLIAVGTWRHLGGSSRPPDGSRAARQPREQSETPATIAQPQPHDDAEHAGEDSATGANDGQPHDPDAAAIEPPAEKNYRPILRGLGVYEGGEGAFPSGTAGPPELAPPDRLSWLASLLDYYDHADWRQELDFDRSWNHERNRRVTQRRLELVINPSINGTTGKHGYPVTHFVGLAGWGADAAELKSDHPRAGVFGYDRRLTVQGIVEGRSNTIAIMGVTARLGPWAQGGPATVRALTQEPYVNGPDGFGTGQTEGMLVGMLDGSVRFIAKDVDSRVLKQLATVNGHTGADVAAGGPASVEPPPTVDAPPRASAEAGTPSHDETAADAVAAEENPAAQREPGAETPPPDPIPPAIDVAARLDDRLAGIKFDAMPLTDFLEFISQMSTIPITLDVDCLTSMGPELNSPVSVEMSDSTVAEILGEALSPWGLMYEIIDGQLLVSVPREKRDALTTVRYRVDDLATGDGAMKTFEALVQRLVEPGSWGDEAAGSSIRIEGDSLVVRQTAAVHDRLLVFCEKLRLARGRTPRGGNRSDSISLESHHARARQVLDAPLAATFFEPTRLRQIVNYLERAGGAEILVDWHSLWTEGVYHDAKATLRCDGCPLREALEAITEPLELTYRVIDERTLQITTRRADALRPVLEVYSIAKLLAQGEKADTVARRLRDSLADGWHAEAAAMKFDAASESLLVLDSHRAQRRSEQLLADWQALPAEDRGSSEP